MQRVLFLTRYAPLGASSRYRVYQYLPFLSQEGVEGVVRPLFSNAYLQRLYSDRPRWRKLWGQVPVVVGALTRRWWLLLREISDCDIIFVQYEALPYLPFALEKRLFTSGLPVVVDYDDAVYLNYEQHPNPLLRRILRSKVSGIVTRSRQVIAGNRYLAEWATKFNSNVTVIPTSVDLRKYPLGTIARPANAKPVIGWIGTPITARYLKLLERALRALRTRHDFVLKVIGAPDFRMDGIEIVRVPWNESTEVDELRTCDIGVMPISDEPWGYGKSALKLIQYLAAGVAAVASPVGANCDVVKDGENGLFARTESDWVEKLALLIEQPALRRQLAETGRHTVEESFSLQANAPRFVDVLRRATSA